MPSNTPPALLPSHEVILQLKNAGLSPETLAVLINEDRKGKQRFAIANSLMGGFCFLGVVAGFIYLVTQGKETMACVLLGVEVLAIVKQMLGARL